MTNKGFIGNIAPKMFLFAALILLAANVSAFSNADIKVNNPIFVKGTTEVTVTVLNNSSVEKELKLEFIGPDWLEYEFIKYPDSIKAMNKSTFKIRLNPEESELLGKQYSAALAVTLDNETVKKDLSLNFLSSSETAVVPEPGNNQDNNAGNPPNPGPWIVLTVQDVELAVNILLLIIIVVLMVTLVRHLRK